jgi:uncharacterized protein
VDDQTRTKLEAAAFRALVAHLQKRKDVQNIELMNLSGFCRNCMSKWYMAAAKQHDISMSYDDARKIIYGMPYDEWKSNYQHEASDEQKQIFQDTKALHSDISNHNK